jgi:glycosyltransferase involved in cell wall biosynthesis
LTPPPVSIVTVTRGGFFFTRLLVNQVRKHTRGRHYEIVVVDRGSRDETRPWLKRQPDVRLLSYRQWWTRSHGHGEAAEYGVRKARFEHVVLLDSDAHPIDDAWLEGSVDHLSEQNRLAGAVFVDHHKGNPYGWYVHPHFMCFFKADLDGLVVLRKLRGDDTDTGEEATIRVLEAGREVVRHPILFASDYSVGHPRVPTVAGGVFHAWYVSRLENAEPEVIRETEGAISRAAYLDPLLAKLRAVHGLAY